MDLKAPIDITAVMTAVKKHKDLLKAVDRLEAMEVLQHFTPMPGITDSIELGKVEGGTISSKYNGVFLGDKKMGVIVPRRLVVRPVVMEMADEPERYRRSYIAEVPGEVRKEHPFELWIIQHGHNLASEDLLNAIFIAKYSAAANDLEITDAFDGIGTVLGADRASNLITEALGNMFVTGTLTRANIGDQLKAMFQSRPETFKRKKSKMFLSATLGDMYDDWRKDEGQIIIGQTEETAGTQYLLGSNGKCELVRLPNLPEGSQFVLLTTRANLVYGFDKESDFKSIRPFMSGNPYLFTATGKYVIGFQAISIHKTEFCVNEAELSPDVKTLGTLVVNITPAAAVTAGAQWRLEGETAWRDSGDSVPVGTTKLNIEYKEVAGYVAPTSAALTSVTATAGQTSTIAALYVAE